MGNLNRCKMDEVEMTTILRRLVANDLPNAVQWAQKEYAIVAPKTMEDIEQLRALQAKASSGGIEEMLALLDTIAPGLGDAYWKQKEGVIKSGRIGGRFQVREELALIVKAVDVSRWTGVDESWSGAAEWRETVELIWEKAVLDLHMDYTRPEKGGLMVCLSLSDAPCDRKDLSLRTLFENEVESWFDARDKDELAEDPPAWNELILLERDLRYGLKLIEAVKGLTTGERLARQLRIDKKWREAYLAQQEKREDAEVGDDKA